MVIDAHMHVFPDLRRGHGVRDTATHLLYLQRFVAVAPAQAVRRVSDNAIEPDKEKWSVWDDSDPTPAGALDVDFRVGRFGQLRWTKNGVDYFLHLYAPSLQDMEASPEFLVAQMDYAGVGRGVLQNAWLYGQLNEYFAEAVRRFPDRFIGTAQVNEAHADEPEEIAELSRAVNQLGLQALYFANARYFETGYRDALDDEKFEPFWRVVEEFGLPVFWDLTAIRDASAPDASPFERFLAQMRRFARWKERHPSVPSILVHGVPLRYIRKGNGFEPIPEEIWRAWEMPNVYLEVLFPMQVSHPVPGGSSWDYPYREVHPLIRDLFRRLGAERLVWGSDMPNTERNCTYKQSRHYLEAHCDFLSESERDLVLARNAARIFDVAD